MILVLPKLFPEFVENYLGLTYPSWYDQWLQVGVEVALYEDQSLPPCSISRIYHYSRPQCNVETNSCSSQSYLTREMLWVALYWRGISMRAARAKAVSFFEVSVFSDMIFVKLTNCVVEQWINKKVKSKKKKKKNVVEFIDSKRTF